MQYSSKLLSLAVKGSNSHQFWGELQPMHLHAGRTARALRSENLDLSLARTAAY